MPTMLIRHHALYYHDIGSGFPILFGHSYLWDRNMWQPQVEYLSQFYRCIVPDLWSHGFSEEIPQRPYSIDQLSEDYHYLMNALGLKAYAVVGLSVGGMWATALALKHPHSVKALALLDTYVGAETLESKSAYFNLLAQIEQSQKFTDEIIALITPYFFCEKTIREKPQLIQRFQSALKQTPHERLAGLIELGHTIFNRPDMLGRLGQLSMPVLVACGAQDMPRPPEETQQMAALIPNASMATIPQAGHIANLEQPQYTNELLGSFLQKALAEQNANEALAEV